MTQETFKKISWGSVIVSLLLVFVAWGSDVNWEIGELSAYQWFPLFGLIAWTVMAGHYYMGALRLQSPGLKKPAHYEKVTSYLVLGSLLLHPTILAIKQNAVGEGTPPQSFINYAGEGFKLAVMLGSLSLILFLSFEVLNRLQKTAKLKKMWWLVSLSQSLAMIFIWVHAMRLGGIVEQDWFRFIWILYGVALFPCFYLIHKADFEQK